MPRHRWCPRICRARTCCMTRLLSQSQASDLGPEGTMLSRLSGKKYFQSWRRMSRKSTRGMLPQRRKSVPRDRSYPERTGIPHTMLAPIRWCTCLRRTRCRCPSGQAGRTHSDTRRRIGLWPGSCCCCTRYNWRDWRTRHSSSHTIHRHHMHPCLRIGLCRTLARMTCDCTLAAWVAYRSYTP